MGSSPSTVVEVPPGHHIKEVHRTSGSSSAPSRRHQRGFQEVQIRHADGSSTSRDPKTDSRNGRTSQRRQGNDTAATSGDGGDFHSIAGMMQREKTMLTEFEQPKYDAKDDLVLESYHHKSGAVYSCVYQNGQRFYLDSWQTQDWQPFPQHWYKEGILETEKILGNEWRDQDQGRQSGQNAGGTAESDDREGFIDHPTRGRLPTYMFEEKRNVHYYYDKRTGCWIRLPIAWELNSELIQKLMGPIAEALPDWSDQHDLLATLRASNYDPHDCIATYLALDLQSGDTLAVPRNSQEASAMKDKDDRIKELERKNHALKQKLARVSKALEAEQQERRAAESSVQELKEEVSTFEVEARTAAAALSAIQRERPKTAAKSSRMPTPAPQPAVDHELVMDLNGSAKLLHKDYIKLKMEIENRFEELQNQFRQVTIGVSQISSCDSGLTQELDEVKELYRREALQRKLLYNKLQELRGNIRVFCRCRYDDRTECCLQFPSDREVLPPGQRKGMKFDKVFTPSSTQEEVFEDTMPIITSCVDGYNVCILAYGQTGSGKTYTMQGPRSDPGVNIRSLQELLKICDERDNIQYTLKASMIEIYNETIHDLLSSDVHVLEIKAHGNKVHLPGVSELLVERMEDIEHIMKMGEKNRTVAATKMNSQSSRSHLIFMVTVEGHNKASSATSTGKLTLCDLAGSERVGKTEAQGQRLVEAAAINKSLSSLGQVFTALRTGQLHIPYRNSKLTHMLQPSLGGDAKACLFVAVSPDQSNLQESISSLQFGSNARQVALGQAKQNVKRQPVAPPANQAWDLDDI